MKTNVINTRDVILSKWGRSNSQGLLNHFDLEYLLHECALYSRNIESLYADLISNKKPVSVAKNILCTTINQELYFNDYDTVCTYNQLEKIFQNDINIIIDRLVKFIELERKEYQEDNS